MVEAAAVEALDFFVKLRHAAAEVQRRHLFKGCLTLVVTSFMSSFVLCWKNAGEMHSLYLDKTYGFPFLSRTYDFPSSSRCITGNFEPSFLLSEDDDELSGVPVVVWGKSVVGFGRECGCDCGSSAMISICK